MTMTEEPPAADLLATGWQPIAANPFNQLIGPILFLPEGDETRFCFRIDARHENGLGRPHGGMIMAFCDNVFGIVAKAAGPGAPVMTVGFDCQFVGAASRGELVEIMPIVTKAGRSLIFVRGVCMASGRVIANCNGIWKVIRAQ